MPTSLSIIVNFKTKLLGFESLKYDLTLSGVLEKRGLVCQGFFYFLFLEVPLITFKAICVQN